MRIRTMQKNPVVCDTENPVPFADRRERLTKSSGEISK